MKIPEHYSLVKEHKDSYEIHDKRDGQKFHVAKRGLHPVHSNQIKGIQKFAEGGEVDDPFDLKLDDTFKTPQMSTMEQAPVIPQAPEMLAPAQPQIPMQIPVLDQQINLAPQAPAVEQQTLQPETQTPPTPETKLPDLTSIENQMASAINLEAQAKAQQQQNLASIYEKHMAEEQRIFDTNQNEMMNLQTQGDKLREDVISNKVDPDRYWNSKSTGQKVMTTLGILLGGIGAGLQQTTRNMAWESLQNRIDRDIQAQKDELGKKQSLLADNYRQRGDLQQAFAATKLQMNEMLQGKIAQMAAQSNNPVIQAEAQMRIAKMKQDNIPLQAALIEKQTEARRKKEIIGRMKMGEELDAIDLINAGIIPKEYQGDAYKEQAAHNAKKMGLEGAEKLYTQMEETHSQLKSNPQAWSKMKMLESQLTNTIMNASGTRRLSKEVVEQMIEPFRIGILDTDKTVRAKKQGLINLINKSADPTPLLEKYGIAKPVKTEDAPDIQTRNGVPYQFNKAKNRWEKLREG